MARRVPNPEGFDETLRELVEIDKIINEANQRHDDLIIKLTVEQGGSLSTIGEALKITAGSVTSRRDTALRRRRQGPRRSPRR